MDQRFVCRDCGTKWFVHEHRVGEVDLVACGRCGGSLEGLRDDPLAGGSHGWSSAENEGRHGDDPAGP